MKLSNLYQYNTLAMSKVTDFRSSVSLDRERPHNQHFHEHKNKYNYFGFVDIDIDNCSPFTMFSCNDDLVAMTYFWYGANSYERMSISEWVSRSVDSNLILDVGSFTGLYSLAAAFSKKELNSCKIFAFEPTRRVHSRLLMNIQINKLRKVVEPINLAISNCSDTVRFFQYRADNVLGNGASFINKGIEYTSDEEVVKTISLDEFIDKKKIKPELIKIDVEQAEVLALKGMEQAITDYSPTILIEVAPNTFEESVAILLSHNYKLFVINEEKRVLESIDKISNSKVVNILAEK